MQESRFFFTHRIAIYCRAVLDSSAVDDRYL